LIKLTHKRKLVIIFIIVIAVCASIFVLNVAITNQKIVEISTTSPAATNNITYSGQDGKNALELLKQKAQVVTKNSSMGEYVVSINGNDGGGKKYWIFYINGQESTVGAGTYTTKSSDNLEWKLK
jgi:hypothetical protein